jgi:hypothetical protein
VAFAMQTLYDWLLFLHVLAAWDMTTKPAL